ncbi:MAG: hypothetical protein KJZ83_04765 [Burkholderiaceae bacterium]|nr:hypothetical protein [Burkholderiaceae bacterium]
MSGERSPTPRAAPRAGQSATPRTRARARGVAAAALALALGFALACAGARAEQDHPKRKAGLWEVRGASAQASGLPPTRFCVGERTDTRTSHLDRSVGERGACSLGAFRRAGQSWLAESVCRESRSVVVSRAIASGDFETEYRIDTLVTYDPPLGGVRREDREAIVARFLGPCANGQKAGDVVVPGMGTLNMVDGTFRAEPVPGPQSRSRAKSDARKP